MKNIGTIMALIGAIMLILPTLVSSLSELVDYNTYTIVASLFVVGGIIAHIILNKRLPL